jgi:putative SOS response-associated peptidase YedK
VTTTPNEDVAELHNRMPVILEPADWPDWLGEVEADPATLMRPAPDGTLRTWPVSRRVGSPRNNDADLMAPIAVA